jgi:hypothetical protein
MQFLTRYRMVRRNRMMRRSSCNRDAKIGSGLVHIAGPYSLIEGQRR